MSKVLVLLAQGCEEIEAVTVIDILRRGNIEVVVAGLDHQPVKASRGVVLLADITIDRAAEDAYDMIVLPGGMNGTKTLAADPRVITLVRKMAAEGKWVAAICAAPLVLVQAGVLNGKNFTAYPGVLASDAGGGLCTDEALMIDDNIVTSRGPGTAMDFALKLVELAAGKEVRYRVESGLVR